MATKAATKAPDTKQTVRRPTAKSAAVKSGGRIVETAQEARSAEPGPSVLALLTVSTVAAVFVLGIVWFIFFRA
ncbi:MAG: hypothetical protein J0I29_12700 [Rhizobiales bacterium]|nr:hypothetical protein [Hyphomicrobiales bacterium]